MKPPICEVCLRRIGENEEGKLLYFKRSPRDREWDKKAEEPGFDGHPPYAAWFCSEHLEKAENLTYLILPEAMEKIKKELK
jgi:hypothetical protein